MGRADRHGNNSSITPSIHPIHIPIHYSIQPQSRIQEIHPSPLYHSENMGRIASLLWWLPWLGGVLPDKHNAFPNLCFLPKALLTWLPVAFTLEQKKPTILYQNFFIGSMLSTYLTVLACAPFSFLVCRFIHTSCTIHFLSCSSMHRTFGYMQGIHSVADDFFSQFIKTHMVQA